MHSSKKSSSPCSSSRRVPTCATDPSRACATTVGAIDPDVLSFTVGKDPVLDLDLVEWDCLGSAAHATMLAKMKFSPRIFSIEERDAVVAELAKIAADARAGRFAITEADQDCHLAIERTLTERLGDLGRRVHTGRSRNDQVATALRLYGRDQLLGVYEETLDLAYALTQFGFQHKLVPMVGRTHLQPAMPSTVGLWATSFAESLLDDLFAVDAAYTVTNRNPLGAAAGYGVPLPIDRELTTKLLAFDAPVHNTIYATGFARGKCEALTLSALAGVMATLSRLAEDLILFSMPEFGYFSLPREFCTGSSIMPQKYNPDVCELLRAKAARVMASASGAMEILRAMPGGYNRDLQETKEPYMEGFRTTRAALRILARLVGGIEVHEDRLRAGFSPAVFATDRALQLVAAGTPWRDAYHQVRDHLEDLESMDPDAAVAAKKHLGATNGVEFVLYGAQIGERRHELADERRRLAAAEKKLFRPLAK